MSRRYKAAIDYFTPVANQFASLPNFATFGHRILEETAECMRLCESGNGGEREYVSLPQIQMDTENLPASAETQPAADDTLD